MNQDKGEVTFRRLKPQSDGILTSLPSGHDLLDFGQIVFLHDLVTAVVYLVRRNNKNDSVDVRGEVKSLQSDRKEGPAPKLHELLRLIAAHANPGTGCSDDGCGSHRFTFGPQSTATLLTLLPPLPATGEGMGVGRSKAFIRK